MKRSIKFLILIFILLIQTSCKPSNNTNLDNSNKLNEKKEQEAEKKVEKKEDNTEKKVEKKYYKEEELSKQKTVTFFSTIDNPFLKDNENSENAKKNNENTKQSAENDNSKNVNASTKNEKAVELLKNTASSYDEKTKTYTGFEEKGKLIFVLGDNHFDISYKDNPTTKLMVQDIKYTNQGKSSSVADFVFRDSFIAYQGVENLPKVGDIILESALPKDQLRIANNSKFSDNAKYKGTLVKMVFPEETFEYQVGYELKNDKDPIYQLIVSRIKLENDSYLKVIHINKIEVK